MARDPRTAWLNAYRHARWREDDHRVPRAACALDRAADDCLRARAYGDGAWPRMDVVHWRAWNFCGRPGGSWEAHKRSWPERARCMQLLAAAVRRGERLPGGRAP